VSINSKEIIFAIVTGVCAALAIYFMSALVASPKLLFGRSLSAIAPSLFPYVTLIVIGVLSAGLVLISLFGLYSNRRAQAFAGTGADEQPNAAYDWPKVAGFFVVLTAYGLLLKPLGFLISSFIVIFTVSVILGNRNWLQIVLLAFFAPVCLYLLATRAMLVSLPELNAIELFYSQIINWVKGMIGS